MKKNIGKVDKVSRIIVGVMFIGLGILTGNWLGVIGFIPIATAIVGSCPIYSLLEMDTCSDEDDCKID